MCRLWLKLGLFLVTRIRLINNFVFFLLLLQSDHTGAGEFVSRRNVYIFAGAIHSDQHRFSESDVRQRRSVYSFDI